MLLCLKRNVSQTFKSSSCRKSFQSVYIIDTTWFDECFLFHYTTGRHYSLYKLSVTAMLHCSLKQIFWKKSAFYIRYLHSNIKMLLMPKVQLLKFIDSIFYSFSLWIFHISFINENFKNSNAQKLSRGIFFIKNYIIKFLISENKNRTPDTYFYINNDYEI